MGAGAERWDRGGMTATALPTPARAAARVHITEALFGRVAIALIALHVVDDSFLQPNPGTSVTDHLASGLIPTALLALAAWAYTRLGGPARGMLAAFLGPLGIAAGIEAVYYASEVGASGDDFTGFAALVAGLALFVSAPVTLWRTRRTDGRRAKLYGRRGLLAVAALLVLQLVVFPIGLAYVVTHTARAVVPDNELGAAYENVTFTTSDGLELEGWYIPSKNGAAVISFPGRKGPQRQARMLGRHGYGVLLFDRRGEGHSDGDPNIFGWGGDRDIKAAIDYLQSRPDVDPDRIGGIGLSVGGEMMIEAAAETDELKAVVSEGAGARAYSDSMREPMSSTDRPMLAIGTAIRVGALAVFDDQLPPRDLREHARHIEQPLLLIGAPNSKHGEELNRGYARAAGASAELWEIPESKHVGGITARPAEYERRVIGFFDRALAR
jgi:predicted alpha/beta hydrolase